MSLKQITSKQNFVALVDARRAMCQEAYLQKEMFCSYFNQIFKTSHEQIQTINYPYFGASDTMFAIRNTQIEWMFSQQIILNLDDDTVFEAILLMDKYISLKGTNMYQISKLAAVCLILSSKSNQIYPIKLSKLNQISRSCYTNAQYCQLQMQILTLFDFNLPHGSLYQIFKLYEITYNLSSVFKKDSTMFLLKKCIMDYDLLHHGVKATALAAVSYLCELKRILINTSLISQPFRQYSQALLRISQLISQSKTIKHPYSPISPSYEHVIV